MSFAAHRASRTRHECHHVPAPKGCKGGAFPLLDTLHTHRMRTRPRPGLTDPSRLRNTGTTTLLAMAESTTMARPPRLLRRGKGDIDTPTGSAMTRDTALTLAEDEAHRSPTLPHRTSSERHRLRFAPTTMAGGVESS